MNKFFLTLIAAATAGSAMGAISTPVAYEDIAWRGFSSNGRYVYSEVYGTVKIFDLQTGEETVFEAVDGKNAYSLGYGSFATPDGGILVGSTLENVDAAYYDGEWHQLQVPDPEKTNLSQGITPDGSRICGSVGAHDLTLDEDVIMQMPAYWDRNEDGTYGTYHILPYPTKDFFGETPQYITALNITADGKTIIGQVVDGAGSMTVPIIYTEDENGEWSYSLPTKDLFNPEGIEAVENPGDGPAGPSMQDYMTDEEKAAYQEAYEAWQESGYTLPFPSMDDYMSEEELAAYNAANEKYEEEYNEWYEKWCEYCDYIEAVLATSPSFLFNNSYLSPDDKKLAITAVTSEWDPMSWWPKEVYTPWILDLATNDIVKYESDKSISVNGYTNEYVLASNGLREQPVEGYVLKDGEITSIYDYINNLSPEYGKWFKKNMSHEMFEFVYNEEIDDWEEVFTEMFFSGIPVATPDMSKIGVWSNTPWDYSLSAYAALFDMGVLTGVDSAVAEECGVALDAAGNLQVTGVAETLAVYDVAGVCVKNVSDAQGTVALDLQHGVYVVKATFAGGVEKVLKIAK